jgi:hypothetical protein
MARKSMNLARNRIARRTESLLGGASFESAKRDWKMILTLLFGASKLGAFG